MNLTRSLDSLRTRRPLDGADGAFDIFSIERLEAAGAKGASALPRCLKVLLENMLRHEDGHLVDKEKILAFADHAGDPDRTLDIAFHPTRILMNDSAGIPLMADLSAMRSAAARQGGDAAAINPVLPCDLVVDHSVMVDRHGDPTAIRFNLDLEYRRNGERYRFLRWAAREFDNFRVVAPGKGICHQVNLEYLSRCVWSEPAGGDRRLASSETLLGTDSHTPMINALGVLGWGVGGIEAGAAMLGQPVMMTVPRVVGCRLVGSMPAGVTATDLALTVTERLRRHGVIGTFVEFFGPGLANLVLADRATVANMAPEYGATMGYFPVDEETLRYLADTARGGPHLRLVEAYSRAQGLWHSAEAPQPDYRDVVTIDLSTVEPSVAGPSRPQDRLALGDVAGQFDREVASRLASLPRRSDRQAEPLTLEHGDIVIASITSCTNTSNPGGLLCAGLLARNAVERGLTVRPWTKTSLAPGSRVVASYLESSGLQRYLDQLGFGVVGFGCMTCMGNSGPLDPAVAEALAASDIHAVAVLSGNRNFEGRIHPLAKANYICSPALVVAYAIAGNVRVDLSREPLGTDRQGGPVFLEDIWPAREEISDLEARHLTPDLFSSQYSDIFDGDPRWNAIAAPIGKDAVWEPESAYMKQPPFFDDFTSTPPEIEDIVGGRALAMFGDSLTTDHISPVGVITEDSAAGRYLRLLGVAPQDFNSFAARRVNHDVMIRGAFANIRIRNEIAGGVKGGVTRHQPSGDLMPIHEAAARYRRERVPLVVIAGKEYGTGSSRDWAAKGTSLLGIRAVIAESFERIHRSNLVALGVAPLEFMDCRSRNSLRLDGSERFDVFGLAGVRPRAPVTMRVTRADGSTADVRLRARFDNDAEVAYFNAGGILPHVLRLQLGTAAR